MHIIKNEKKNFFSLRAVLKLNLHNGLIQSMFSCTNIYEYLVDSISRCQSINLQCVRLYNKYVINYCNANIIVIKTFILLLNC